MITVREVFNHIPTIINQQPQISQAALEDVGEFVRQKAHDRCPVKGSTSADGYYHSPWPAGARAGEVRQSIKTWVVNPFQVRVGSNHMIAALLEFGQGLGPPVSVTAKPYMRPAVDENQEEIKNRFGEQFAVRIRTVTG